MVDNIDELRELSVKEDNGFVSRQLLDLNKDNLKETYVLEDLQLEHDGLMT